MSRPSRRRTSPSAPTGLPSSRRASPGRPCSCRCCGCSITACGSSSSSSCSSTLRLQVVFGTDAARSDAGRLGEPGDRRPVCLRGQRPSRGVARAARLPARRRGERPRPDRSRAFVLHRLAAATSEARADARARERAAPRAAEAAPPVPRGEGEEVIGLFPRP